MADNDDDGSAEWPKPGGRLGAVRRESYFPTLLYIREFQDHGELNPMLLATIRAEQASDATGITRSNVPGGGGWHSNNNLHKDPGFQPFAKRIDITAKQIAENLGLDPNWPLTIQNMWAIVNPPGSFNTSHVHPNSQWSGVYYVQAPEAAGRIKFIDPRAANVMAQARFDPERGRPPETWTETMLEPVPGRLIIFPAWLYHSVEMNCAEPGGEASDRIVISFNLTQRPLRN